MRRFVCFWLSVVTFLAFVTPMAHATRIKDVADFEGVRDNMLVGYGLVVGLDGTGDSLNKAVFTKESFIAMLDRLGVRAREEALDSKRPSLVVGIMAAGRVEAVQYDNVADSCWEIT